MYFYGVRYLSPIFPSKSVHARVSAKPLNRFKHSQELTTNEEAWVKQQISSPSLWVEKNKFLIRWCWKSSDRLWFFRSPWKFRLDQRLFSQPSNLEFSMEKCYRATESRRPHQNRNSVYSDHGYGVRWLRDHRVLYVCDIRTGPNMNKLIRPIKKFASNPQHPGLFQNDTDFFFSPYNLWPLTNFHSWLALAPIVPIRYVPQAVINMIYVPRYTHLDPAKRV